MSNVFEELNQERKQINDRVIRLEANLEHQQSQQEAAKQQAIKLFGTDDPVELQRIVDEGKEKNRQIEEQMRATNEIVGNVLSLLESGADVPPNMIAQLDTILAGAGLQPNHEMKAQSEKKANQKSQQQVEQEIESSLVEATEKQPEPSIEDDLSSLDKAISTLDVSPEDNPLNKLVENAKSTEKQVSQDDAMFSEEDELSVDDLGAGLDVNELGTLESVVESMPQESQKPVAQEAPAAFKF